MKAALLLVVHSVELLELIDQQDQAAAAHVQHPLGQIAKAVVDLARAQHLLARSPCWPARVFGGLPGERHRQRF